MNIENMLTLRAIKRMANDELRKVCFPIGAIIEVKEEAMNNRIVTSNASLASSFDSTPFNASTSSSPAGPATPPRMNLEMPREAVGHLNTNLNYSKRKNMNSIVCEKLIDISSKERIMSDLNSISRRLLEVVLKVVVVAILLVIVLVSVIS